MRRSLFAVALLATLVSLHGAASRAGLASAPTNASVVHETDAALPRVSATLSAAAATLTPNTGWTDPRARWFAHCRRYRAWLTDDGAVFRVPGPSAPPKDDVVLGGQPESASTAAVLELTFDGARPGSFAAGRPLDTRSSFFLGDDPSKWRSGVPGFAGTRRSSMYDGVDVVWRAEGGDLAFDLVAAPGADTSAISMRLAGAKSVSVEDGGLVAATEIGDLRMTRPVAWQELDGRRRSVDARFALRSDGRVGFELGAHDAAAAIVIDPTVLWSTYLGASGLDTLTRVAIGPGDSVYGAGYTDSAGFPVTGGVFQSVIGTFADAFVFKMPAGGQGLTWSTYVGGNSSDYLFGLEVDSTGSALISGQTYSTNFPSVTPLQVGLKGGSDSFVCRLNPNATALVFSTYFGGTLQDFSTGVAADPTGAFWLAGGTNSTDFPTKSPRQAALGGGYDAFVARFVAAGNSVTYCTYHGGSADEFTGGDNTGLHGALAVDSSGSCYVGGYTVSLNFPLLAAVQPFPHSTDGFLFKYTVDGQPVYSTYLGGVGIDAVRGVAVDPTGAAYVVGTTDSADFPTKNAIQPSLGGVNDAFVTKLIPSGTGIVWSTYLGGATGGPSGGSADFGDAIALGADGSVFVVASGRSTDFPLANPFQAANAGNYDAEIVRILASGTGLIFSSYYGGSNAESPYDLAVDGTGAVVVAGISYSTNLLLTSPYQSLLSGTHDGFLIRLAQVVPNAPTGLAASTYLFRPVTLSWTDTSSDETSFVVERRSGALPFTIVRTTSANATTTTDDQIEANTLYTYRVRAVGPEAQSAPSNEVMITSASSVAVPPPPEPPGSFDAEPLSATEASLTWIDLSDYESGYEVQRRVGGAAWTSLGAFRVDTASLIVQDLVPGWRYSWRVRAVSFAGGASLFSDTDTIELPASMEFVVAKASLKNAAVFQKDTISASGTYSFLAGVTDGAWNPVTDGLAVGAGAADSGITFTIPPSSPGWKVKKSKLTWKSAKGALPKTTVVIDTAKHTFSVTLASVQLPEAPDGNLLVLFGSADDGGLGKATGRLAKPGAWKFP